MELPALYPRLAEARLLEALSDTPVVLVHGPRQCGKTTLAQHVGRKHRHAYFTFDDDATLAAATADPLGFVGDLPDRVILDEVYRPSEVGAVQGRVLGGSWSIGFERSWRLGMEFRRRLPHQAGGAHGSGGVGVRSMRRDGAAARAGRGSRRCA